MNPTRFSLRVFAALLALGSLALVLSFSLPPPLMPLAAEAGGPLWSRWIVAFDAAVLEELGFRLFLVSLLVWVLSWKRLPASRWSVTTRVWISITLVALGFASAHLPKWLAFAPPSMGLVASVLVLNGIGGLAFGFLFWRFGIEAAMAGHFAADAVLHVLGPWLSLR